MAGCPLQRSGRDLVANRFIQGQRRCFITNLHRLFCLAKLRNIWAIRGSAADAKKDGDDSFPAGR
ncbi:hypothetical protein ACFOVT_14525 [Novosphingobium lubricantis]